MSRQNKVSGVVLAGGRAQRMGGLDKGLLAYRDQPLVSYALTALRQVVDQCLISANRHHDRYGAFGVPVLGDGNDHFDGPLAGILAAMQAANHPRLLVVPCDSPLITATHLQRLLLALDGQTEIAVAFDGERLHPVFAALKTDLQNDLRGFLLGGERKLGLWMQSSVCVNVDLSDQPQVFFNVNTQQDLLMLEKGVTPL